MKDALADVAAAAGVFLADTLPGCGGNPAAVSALGAAVVEAAIAAYLAIASRPNDPPPAPSGGTVSNN